MPDPEIDAYSPLDDDTVLAWLGDPEHQLTIERGDTSVAECACGWADSARGFGSDITVAAEWGAHVITVKAALIAPSGDSDE